MRCKHAIPYELLSWEAQFPTKLKVCPSVSSLQEKKN